jgi:hypothetical protein
VRDSDPVNTRAEHDNSFILMDVQPMGVLNTFLESSSTLFLSLRQPVALHGITVHLKFGRELSVFVRKERKMKTTPWCHTPGENCRVSLLIRCFSVRACLGGISCELESIVGRVLGGLRSRQPEVAWSEARGRRQRISRGSTLL